MHTLKEWHCILSNLVETPGCFVVPLRSSFVKALCHKLSEPLDEATSMCDLIIDVIVRREGHHVYQVVAKATGKQLEGRFTESQLPEMAEQLRAFECSIMQRMGLDTESEDPYIQRTMAAKRMARRTVRYGETHIHNAGNTPCGLTLLPGYMDGVAVDVDVRWIDRGKYQVRLQCCDISIVGIGDEARITQLFEAVLMLAECNATTDRIERGQK